MIVVDSSVWIASLRGFETSAVRKLRELDRKGRGQVLVGDLILLEVLQGARDEAHAARLAKNLRRFPIAAMLDTDIAERTAGNYRALRARGITVRKTIDMIIGTFCVERGHLLLHDDRDFEPMVAHCGLIVL